MDEQKIRDLYLGGGVACLAIVGSVLLVLLLIVVGVVLLLFTICSNGIVKP